MHAPHPAPLTVPGPRSAIDPGSPPILLTSEALAVIRRASRDGYPEEVCGLLLGQNTGSGAPRIVETVLVPNEHGGDRRRRYRIDPADFRAAAERAARTGNEVLGVFHSHPDAGSDPSLEDREDAWPGLVYVVQRTEGRVPLEVTAFRREGDDGSMRRLLVEEALDCPA